MLGPLTCLATLSPGLLVLAALMAAMAFVVPVLFSFRGTTPRERERIIRAWADFWRRR